MSYLFLLFYIVATFLRPQEWVPAFYGKPVIDILAGCTLFCLLFERMGGRKSASGLVRMPQAGLMFGFFACILMSHIVHTYFAGLTLAFSKFLPTFILFFLLLNGINTQGKFKTAVWLIIFLVVILVPQGVYQMEHGYGWAGQEITTQRVPGGEPVFRINWVGIFNDPNDLALTFVIAIGFLLAFVFGTSGFFKRLLSLGLGAALLYGIYLTNSRGGLVALMATVYFYFIARTRKVFWGSIIGGSLGFAAFAFGPSRTALFDIQEASAFNRLELWYQGILMMKASPINLLFGIGKGMFTEELPQTAHNSFILAGTELGLIGLFCWMGLIWVSFNGLQKIQKLASKRVNESTSKILDNSHTRSLDHSIRRDSRSPVHSFTDISTYALGLQSALVGFCAAAFFLSRTYVILPYILFALSGSLMYIAKQQNPELDFRFTKRDFKITFFLTIGVLLMAYVLIKIAL